MPHIPPLRIDVAILMLLVATAALVVVAVRSWRRRHRPPHGIRVDLIGGADKPPAG